MTSRKLQQIKEWKAANPEKQREYDRKYRAANLEKIRAKNRDLDKSRGYSKLKYSKNRELHIAKNAEYRKTITGKAVMHNMNAKRRVRISSGVEVAKSIEIAGLIREAKACHYCRRAFSEILRKTVDHVVPLCRGGFHRISNLVIACGPCNFSKSGKLLTPHLESVLSARSHGNA